MNCYIALGNENLCNKYISLLLWIPLHTRHPAISHTNTPYSHKNTHLDLFLKAASDPIPLSSTGDPAHSFGTLYPTDAWSLVNTCRPAPADLVACPWTFPIRRSIAVWFTGRSPCQ